MTGCRGACITTRSGQGFLVRSSACRKTVKKVLDEENPVYQDLKDVPEYWRPAAAALLDAGVVNGGTPAKVCATDLNLRRETLKAAIVAVMYHDARERDNAGK